MSNKTIAVPYVEEGTIQVVSNNNRYPIDIICEGPPYHKEVETVLTLADGSTKTEKTLHETRDIQTIGTLVPLTSEAVKAEIVDGKCIWRLLK